MDDLKEKKLDWKLKYEAPDLRTLWRTRFGRGYGPAEGPTTERMIIKCHVRRFVVHPKYKHQHKTRICCNCVWENIIKIALKKKQK
jgi:hypothetical protein